MKKLFAALVLALTFSLAAAVEFPTAASVLITSDDGTIVGVGKVVDGEEFELELLIDFSGFGTLVFTTPEGTTHTLEVMVGDGAVTVDLVGLPALLTEAGFSDISITSDDGFANRPEDAGRPDDAGQPEDTGRPDDAGKPDDAGDEANDNAGEGADNADDGMGNADDAASENAGDAPNDNAGEGSGNADDGADNAGDRAPDETPAGGRP